MIKQNRDGRWIISAAEVGDFLVCPEAWKQKAMGRKRLAAAEKSEEGVARHNEWAKNYDEVADLRRRVRLVVMLIIAAILGVILRFEYLRR